MKGRNKKLDNIAKYIDRVQFRKKLFGVNAADVYAAMQDMDNMYQDAMERYSEALEEEFDRREDTIIKNERKIRELADRANSVVEVRKRDQRRIKELEEKLRSVSAERAEYRNQTDILADSISDTKKCKEHILEKARREASLILQQAEEESRRVCQGNSDAVLKAKESYEKNLEQIHMAKSKAKDNLQLIRIDLYDLYKMLSNIQEDMEQNFEKEGKVENSVDSPQKQVNVG